MTPINEMHKLGWIQIDTEKPIKEQVSVGDYVVSTEMYIFDDSNDTFDLDKFNLIKNDFTVSRVYKGGVEILVDSEQFGFDTEEAYLSCDDGIYFVLKSEVKYVNVKVPDFMLDRVKQLGGIEI